MVPLYQLFLVQRSIDQHPAAGPAARIPAADLPEGSGGDKGTDDASAITEQRLVSLDQALAGSFA
jgi:hypothetical protein